MGNAYSLWVAYTRPKELKEMANKLKTNILVGGSGVYTLGVAIVRRKRSDGRPLVLELVDDHESVDLKDPANKNFVTLYLPKRVARPPQPGGKGMRDQP